LLLYSYEHNLRLRTNFEITQNRIEHSAGKSEVYISSNIKVKGFEQYFAVLMNKLNMSESGDLLKSTYQPKPPPVAEENQLAVYQLTGC